MQDTHYQMTPNQALQLAMRIERCAYDFYALTAQGTTDANLKRLAEDMLSSKQHHLALIEALLQKASDEPISKPEDFDPPHMPE